MEVLAEILPVPGSPWFMVAKVDADEILAEARYRGQFILLFTALSMLVTGAMAAFVFSFRQKTLYQNLYRAEHQRRQVEEEIRAAFYSIGDGVISTDAGPGHPDEPRGRAPCWLERGGGVGQAPSAGLSHRERRDPGRGREPCRRVMRDGTIVNLANHTLLMARDGCECPIADSGAPIRDGQGRVTGAVLVFRDQTEERRAEMALQEGEEWYRTLFVEALDGICPVNANTG